MQRVDWLRDTGELREYPCAVAVLYKLKIRTVAAFAESSARIDFDKIIGWMPVDCDHYNKWKAEREKQDCPNCEDGYTPVFRGDVEDREECPKCKGTGAIGGYNIEKGYFWDGECPTCNGTGKIQGWDLDCPDCTGTVAKKETVGVDENALNAGIESVYRGLKNEMEEQDD